MSKKLLLAISLTTLLILILFIATIVLVLQKVRERKLTATPGDNLPETITTVISGQHTLALRQNGKLRSYTVYLPQNFDKTKKYPLVFSLHGGGSNAQEQMGLNDLKTVADKNSFVVAYPNAIAGNWNDGRDYTKEKSGSSDDVAFIKSIIERLGQWVNLDSARIYSTGISNGGMMSLRLACDASETFAAVAPVAAAIPVELQDRCAPKRPVSVLAIQGTADPLVPFNGGEINGLAGRNVNERGVLLSAQESLDFWYRYNYCSQQKQELPIVDKNPSDGTISSQVLYETCNQNTQVGLVTVTNGGHTWPGGKQYLNERLIGKTSQDFSASEIIWEFFKTKTR